MPHYFILFRNIPELIHDDFLKIDLSKYLWIHFEVHNYDTCTCIPKKCIIHNIIHPISLAHDNFEQRTYFQMQPFCTLVITITKSSHYFHTKTRLMLL